MDFFILWAASKIIKSNTKNRYIALGSFVASALYIVIILTLQRNYIFIAPILICVSVAVAFRPRTLKYYLKSLMATGMCAFIVGGICMALYYSLKSNIIEHAFNNFSIWILIFASTCSYAAIKIFAYMVKKTVLNKQQLYDIKVIYKEKTALLTGLVDTGNSLREPISNQPVIVAEFSKIKNIMPDFLKLIYFENEDDNIELIAEQSKRFDFRMRVIPYKSVGQQNGMLIGFRPDKIEFVSGNKSYCNEKAIVAICNYSLSVDKSYDALINPELCEV